MSTTLCTWNNNSNKMQALEKKILNAEGWNNGKFLIGKHCRAFYLGLPCAGFILTIHLLPTPASLKREKHFKVACTKKRKPQLCCWEINVMLRTTTVSGNNTGAVTFPKYSHTPYNEKTHIPYLNTQSLNCPCFKWLMGQHCQQFVKEAGPESRFQPPKSFLTSSWIFLPWIASS